MKTFSEFLYEGIEYFEEGSSSPGWRSFKMREIGQELEDEEREIAMRKARAAAERRAETQGEFHVYINGRVWKKNGKPVPFNTKNHAMAAANTIRRKDPSKKTAVTNKAYTDMYKGKLKEK